MSSPLIRSLLFVPGDNEKLITKAMASNADAIILDLEDAVAPENKAKARAICTHALLTVERNNKPVFVRVNALDTGLTAQDLAAVVAGNHWGVVLPKANGMQEIDQIGYYLDALEARENIAPQSIKILSIATESAESTQRLGTPANTCNPRLWGAMWGDEDLSASLGAYSSRDEQGNLTLPYQHARAQCLYSAATLGIKPVDSVYVDFRDMEGLKAEAKASFRDGFTAKAAIHPAQIDVIHEAMTPSAEQVQWAQQVMALLESSSVGQLDGKMVNQLHRQIANRILAQTGEL